MGRHLRTAFAPRVGCFSLAPSGYDPWELLQADFVRCASLVSNSSASDLVSATSEAWQMDAEFVTGRVCQSAPSVERSAPSQHVITNAVFMRSCSQPYVVDACDLCCTVTMLTPACSRRPPTSLCKLRSCWGCVLTSNIFPSCPPEIITGNTQDLLIVCILC
jgi:hypothetical protein